MITLVILAAVFVSGVIVGVIVLVCASIGREETRNSLYKRPPTRAAATTRRLLGWHGTYTIPGPRPATPAVRPGHRAELTAARP
jgi:hypothetical protein